MTSLHAPVRALKNKAFAVPERCPTIDDDQIMVGPSLAFPWTAYILADILDIESATAACNLIRVTPVGGWTYKLWKYMRIEARLGRELAIPQ
jgi:hypothetical protein